MNRNLTYMRTVIFLLGCALAETVWAEKTACPIFLPKSVEAKLLSVLEARDIATRKNDLWDKDYEEAFATLLDAKDEASIQARIALMDYYVGEAYGEELVCAVALSDGDVASLLELYSRCDITPKQFTGPRNHALPLRGYALKMLKDGHAKESCTYD